MQHYLHVAGRLACIIPTCASAEGISEQQVLMRLHFAGLVLSNADWTAVFILVISTTD